MLSLTRQNLASSTNLYVEILNEIRLILLYSTPIIIIKYEIRKSVDIDLRLRACWFTHVT